MSYRISRSKSVDDILGSSLDKSLATGRQLPLISAVLRRYIYFRQHHQHRLDSQRQIMHVIFNELLEIWTKAGIPLKPKNKCIDYLISLLGLVRAVKKHSSEKRPHLRVFFSFKFWERS